MSEETQLKDRLEIQEVKIAALEEGYKDLAYEFTNSFFKRIETIRKEVTDSVSAIEDHVYAEAFRKIAEAAKGAREKISEAVEEAREKLSRESITGDVVSRLTDGTHVLVTRPASREEQKSGQAVPVKEFRAPRADNPRPARGELLDGPDQKPVANQKPKLTL